MVHGGDLLARRHQAEGDDVTCVDVYGICPQSKKDELAAYDIRVARGHHSRREVRHDGDAEALPEEVHRRR